MHRRVDLRKSKSRAGGNRARARGFRGDPSGLSAAPSRPRPTGGYENAGEESAYDGQAQTTPAPSVVAATTARAETVRQPDAAFLRDRYASVGEAITIPTNGDASLDTAALN